MIISQVSLILNKRNEICILNLETFSKNGVEYKMYETAKRKNNKSHEKNGRYINLKFFSFFKYADRSIFMKKYLSKLKISISNTEAETAEFEFFVCESSFSKTKNE